MRKCNFFNTEAAIEVGSLLQWRTFAVVSQENRLSSLKAVKVDIFQIRVRWNLDGKVVQVWNNNIFIYLNTILYSLFLLFLLLCCSLYFEL